MSSQESRRDLDQLPKQLSSGAVRSCVVIELLFSIRGESSSRTLSDINCTVAEIGISVQDPFPRSENRSDLEQLLEK